MVVALVAGSVVPGVWLYEWLMEHAGILDVPFKNPAASSSRNGVFIVVPIVMWMLVYSLVVIVAKWVVVGRYKAGGLRFNTWGFILWWCVSVRVSACSRSRIECQSLTVFHLLLLSGSLRSSFKFGKPSWEHMSWAHRGSRSSTL